MELLDEQFPYFSNVPQAFKKEIRIHPVLFISSAVVFIYLFMTCQP